MDRSNRGGWMNKVQSSMNVGLMSVGICPHILDMSILWGATGCHDFATANESICPTHAYCFNRSAVSEDHQRSFTNDLLRWPDMQFAGSLIDRSHDIRFTMPTGIGIAIGIAITTTVDRIFHKNTIAWWSVEYLLTRPSISVVTAVVTQSPPYRCYLFWPSNITLAIIVLKTHLFRWKFERLVTVLF